MPTSKTNWHVRQTAQALPSDAFPLHLLGNFTYPLIAVIFVFAEGLINPSVTAFDRPQLWIILTFGTLLATSAWTPVAQILYMICFAATSYWPATADLTFPVLGVYIICIAWIIRGWMIPAFATLAAVGILLFKSSSHMSSQIISTLVMFTLISSTGLVLRSLVRKIRTSAQQLRAAQEASIAIRADLATQLHDTIAKDLARISITTQNIALNHPDLANELVPLADIAQNTARRIRSSILDLDVLANRHSLDQSISISAQMLTTRSITLSIDSEANLDAKLDRETITLASLFVRESATNALKYAPSASNVDLIIELAPEILSLTMRNDVAALPQAGITGGFGLSNLRQRIEASGGSLTFVHNDNEWVIISSIPYSR